jgi:hypothetical protein
VSDLPVTRIYSSLKQGKVSRLTMFTKTTVAVPVAAVSAACTSVVGGDRDIELAHCATGSWLRVSFRHRMPLQCVMMSSILSGVCIACS